MKLVGMCCARNEAWCLGLSARVALRWCDALVILEHASTDRTPYIIAELRAGQIDRVIPITCPDQKWDEMAHRELMLYAARNAGATHLAIIDADEILCGDLLEPMPCNAWEPSAIRDYVRFLPAGHILQLPLYNLRGGIDRYHANGVWGNRIVDVAFADDPRLGWSGDKFHSRAPSGVHLQPYQPIAQGQGGVMHLWGSSERRLRAKHAHYKITEALRWPNKPVAGIDQMYSWAIKGGDPYETADKWAYAPVPPDWWAGYGDLMQYLDVDAEPWQEQAVRAAVAEHGRERFAGLDLFGCDE